MNLLEKDFASLAFDDFAFDVAFDFEKGLEPDVAADQPSERVVTARHARGDKAVVCKHWLRGLCKKGDMCEFLHEYDLQRMPVCYFYSKYGECSNPDCVYRHISAEENMRECPWYNRGFCKHGPNCRNKHAKKIACENYLTGFCTDGPNCKFGHPKYELPKEDEPAIEKQKKTISTPMGTPEIMPKDVPPHGQIRNPQRPIICRRCGTPGHKSPECPNIGPDGRPIMQNQFNNEDQFQVPMQQFPPAYHRAPMEKQYQVPTQNVNQYQVPMNVMGRKDYS